MNKPDKKKNVSASVHQRLVNLSKHSGETHDYLLVRFAIERFLYRLSLSPYADQLILKGGTLLLAWQGKSHRVTRDVDFLAFASPDLVQMEAIFSSICTYPIDFDDGISFFADSIQCRQIIEEKQYTGIRIEFKAKIQSFVVLTVDIGFGDVITPKVENVEFPTFFDDMPAPKLRAYPKYTVISEKFETMISLGMANSRQKDFYDIWYMSQQFDFDGDILKQAIEKTFAKRKTALPKTTPMVFTEDFYANLANQAQWKNFVKKLNNFDKSLGFEHVVKGVAAFLMPIVLADDGINFRWSSTDRVWQNRD
jgi:predicted nucleotidyltransferase component of viral defense system